jgi:hypothetical protein
LAGSSLDGDCLTYALTNGTSNGSLSGDDQAHTETYQASYIVAVTLSGSESDADGTIASYCWSKNYGDMMLIMTKNKQNTFQIDFSG